MLNIDRALDNSRILRSLTGLSAEQFAELAKKFQQVLSRQTKAERKKRNPQRAAGGGRPHTLESAEAKLFFILFYLRVYPTMEVAGFLFDVTRSVICDWVKLYQPILEKTLGTTSDLPKRKIRSVEEFIREFPDAERVIIDSTERPRQRPKDKERQKSEYSGKKKRHTMKNTMAVDPGTKRILVLLPTVRGATSDKRDLDESGLVEVIPEDVPIDLDLGYKGLEHDYDGLRLPQKKPRGGALTDAQKESNREHARRRVVVEHCIGHAKRYRSIGDIYRNRRAGFNDSVMLTCCGLSNFARRVQPGT